MDVWNFVLQSAFCMYLLCVIFCIVGVGLFFSNETDGNTTNKVLRIIAAVVCCILAYGTYQIANFNAVNNCVADIFEAQKKDSLDNDFLGYKTVHAICEQIK